MTNQCAHGQLRRQCDVCEHVAAELKLMSEIDALTAKLDRIRKISDEMDHGRYCALWRDSVNCDCGIVELIREVGR